MAFRNELALKNLYIEQNIVARGGIVGKDIYGVSVHAPSIETQELFVKGVAHITELAIRPDADSIPLGGIRSDGNFLLTDVTTCMDGWITPIQTHHIVVSGNRIGQMCSVYVEITPSNTVLSGSVLFSAIPDSFWPYTKTAIPVSIVDESFINSSATVVFDPTHKQILFFGILPLNATLMSTLNYFRARN